jgi:hypothetical protein
MQNAAVQSFNCDLNPSQSDYYQCVQDRLEQLESVWPERYA